jgi:4-amino-4-deoxy-L-arabinose transferase-like glycosyltransferase
VHAFFLTAFALLVLLIHLPFVDLPFYWDEVGQFVPASLDLYQHGYWVPHMATPNVHPPGVMAYLALVWRIFGFSIPATRLAMLAAAAVAVWLTFLLAIELCRNVGGAPAFCAVILLIASPLFYTQAMMAQLDMPAMLFTVGALLLFLRGRYREAALACTALVLLKETGAVAALVFAAWLIAEKKRREALWFALPFAALAGWLLVLYRATGNPLGNAGFADYNVLFPLHPVRLAIALARRIFTIFVENFHWIGWIAVALAWRRTKIYRSRPWLIAATLGVAQVLAVTVLGGATLERYLLPVLPLIYIAFAAAWSAMPSPGARIGQFALVAGLLACLFWNPPYPSPYENNLALVDFVRLHEAAAGFVERNFPGQRITTAWPLSIELRRPACGYVQHPMAVQELAGFRPADLRTLSPSSVGVFVLFSYEWDEGWDLRRAPLIAPLMRHFYGYQPQAPPRELERRFGLKLAARWSERGQWIAVYERAAQRAGRL